MHTHFSFNFESSPGPASMSPLVAAAAFSTHSISDKEVLLRQTGGGQTALVAPTVVQALELCRQFQPLDQHVAAVTRTLPGMQGQESVVRAVLGDLLSRGLMLRAGDWLNQLRLQSAAATAPAPMRTVIIRTSERPQCVAALLESLREHELRWPRGLRYVLIDQSHTQAIVKANAEALNGFCEATSCHALHLDRSRMAELLTELQRELPEHAESLAYLLDPQRHTTGYHGAYGVGLNWASLMIAGERCLLLDDDHLFPLRLHPNWEQGLRLRPSLEPDRFYPNLESALGDGLHAEHDPLQLHLDTCGHRLSDLLKHPLLRLSESGVLGVVPGDLGELGNEARVMTSSHGHRGDTCAMGIHWLLLQPPGTIRGPLSNPDFYRAQVARPAVWNGSRHFQLVAQRGVTPSVLDGSRLLPPVPPMGRGEDVIFSALLECLYPKDVQIELPMAIGHQRPTTPDRSQAFRRPATPALGLLVGTQIRLWTSGVHGGDGRGRLKVVAAQLEGLASLGERDALHYMQSHLTDVRIDQSANLRAALTYLQDGPAHWKADARSLLESNVAAATSRTVPRYAEWPEEVEGPQAAAFFRAYVAPFAAAVPAWHDAWERAKERAPHWIGTP